MTSLLILIYLFVYSLKLPKLTVVQVQKEFGALKMYLKNSIVHFSFCHLTSWTSCCSHIFSVPHAVDSSCFSRGHVLAQRHGKPDAAFELCRIIFHKGCLCGGSRWQNGAGSEEEHPVLHIGQTHAFSINNIGSNRSKCFRGQDNQCQFQIHQKNIQAKY